jgi:hypothetical protein
VEEVEECHGGTVIVAGCPNPVPHGGEGEGELGGGGTGVLTSWCIGVDMVVGST